MQHRLTFTFNGEPYQGYAGDTLASALIRNKVSVIGRSFKYHRPRGFFAAGADEPNALVTLIDGAATEPNRLATTLPLYEGLVAKSQNYVGSVNFDFMAINDWVSPFLTAGFYYKTFMWPKSFWERIYEPAIRRAAGLGNLSPHPDPDRYGRGDLHTEHLVIGGGPAGLLAAQSLSRAGHRVILCDDDTHWGGRLLSDQPRLNGAPTQNWIDSIIEELTANPRVRLLQRTTVFGGYDHGVYGAVQIHTDRLGEPGLRQTYWRLHTERVWLASGATERSIAFSHNDRPNIMLAGALKTYQNRFQAIPSENVVALSNNSSTLDLAAQHHIDTRKNVTIRDTKGRTRLKSIKLSNGQTLRADYLAVSGGWNPNVHLTCHKRGRPVWNNKLACFVPNLETLPEGMTVIGAADGAFTLSSVFAHTQAALKAAGVKAVDIPDHEDETYTISALWQMTGQHRAWVDLQNDVTVKDITLAHKEGFSSVEHVKRYTTLGMATDQGKTSNVLGLAILATARGHSIEDTGTTIFRPPYTPVSIGALAGSHVGEHFKPTRLTPSHDYAQQAGATFVDTGLWKRTQWVAKSGEVGWRDSVDREVQTTRKSVGICDVSTLGKIDIQGQDVGQFLNLVYANTFSTLKVGRCRYGLMLREDGIAFDDGTTARLSDTHYVMTTTTAKAGPVFRHLEFVHQCLVPHLDVRFMSTTDMWAQFSVAGPRARELLSHIVDPEHDISNAAFPYMACGSITVCGGTRARLFRLSFSGELAYEIAVPSRYGLDFIKTLMQAGDPYGVCLYGTEALGVMRIEKGHPAGNELNGTTTAQSLGLSGIVSKKKDCIGKVLSQREGLTHAAALDLVGCMPVEPKDQLTNGAHFINLDAEHTAANDVGYMSSVAWSPELRSYVGLGFLKAGKSRLGEIITAVDYMRGKHVRVKIVSPHFIDPEGARVRA